jgi:hypothetical protein
MGTVRTDEFRKDAVRIALTSELSRRQVADDLGVGMSTLNKWVTAVSVRPDCPYLAFHGRSSSTRVILPSGMRAKVSASQAWGSTPLSLAVSIRV